MMTNVLRHVVRLGLYAFPVVVSFMLYLPIVVLVIYSFTNSRFPVYPVREWSFRWYKQIPQDDVLINAVGNSLMIGALAAATATVLGLLGAYGLIRSQFPGKWIVSGILVFPLAVPLILLGLSLRVYLPEVGVPPGLFAIYLGHLVYMIPLAVLVCRPRLERFNWTLEESAYELGASKIRILLEIIVPWVLPALIGAFLLTFTFSFDEFIIAWLLSRFDVTLPIKIWTDLLMAFTPKVNAIGTVVFLFSLCLALVAQRFLLRDR